MRFIMRSPLARRVPLAASVAGLALIAASPALAQAKLSDLEHRAWPTISTGASLSGSLDSSDVLREDQTYTDGFVYDAQQGETVTFTMRSPDFNAWLVVDDPASSFLKDDSSADGAAQITITFPHSGRYVILANTVTAHATGNYTLTVAGDGHGSSSTAAATGPAGAKATLADLQHASWPTIVAGASLNGQLDSSDVLRDDGTYTDGFFYDGQEGETITVTMRSPDVDSWLVIDDPDGPLSQHDDDSGGGHDSRLTITLPHAGRYLILANDVAKGSTGNYTLSLTSDRQQTGATTASNHAPNDQWARCSDNKNVYPLDVQIGACTALLQSGQLDDAHLPVAYLDRGVTLYAEGNNERAISDFNDALRLKPDYAKAMAFRGQAELEMHDSDKAVEDFAAALRIDPKDSTALDGQGRLKLGSKDYAAARDLFTQALASEQDDPSIFANRAAAYVGLGDSEHALADFAESLRLDPHEIFALVNRGDLYERLHRYSDAVADFDKAVEVEPSAWHHNMACWERAAFLGAELDRAKSECDKAVALDPKNPEILDSRGMLRFKLKQYDAAWADYDAAIRLNAKMPSYWYGRAMAERAQGKTAAARADIAKAKALDPKIAERYATYGIKP